MKNRTLSLLACLFAFFAAGPHTAQAQDPGSPQILTSDLSRRTVTQNDVFNATFMIVDPNTVTEVRINQEKENITRGGIVIVQKQIVLNNTETLLEIEAQDAGGATRKKSYLIIFEEQMLSPFLISPLLLPSPRVEPPNTIQLLTPLPPVPPGK